MKRLLFPAFLFILLILQGTVLQVFSPEEFSVVPRFILLATLMAAVFYQQRYAIIIGIVFGLLIDIIYTDTLGIYAFTIPFNAYIVSYFKKVFHTYLPVFVLMSVLAVAMLEIEVYQIYWLIGKTNMTFEAFLTERLPGTLVLNAAALILMFFPLRRYLTSLPTPINSAKD